MFCATNKLKRGRSGQFTSLEARGKTENCKKLTLHFMRLFSLSLKKYKNTKRLGNQCQREMAKNTTRLMKYLLISIHNFLHDKLFTSIFQNFESNKIFTVY